MAAEARHGAADALIDEALGEPVQPTPGAVPGTVYQHDPPPGFGSEQSMDLPVGPRMRPVGDERERVGHPGSVAGPSGPRQSSVRSSGGSVARTDWMRPSRASNAAVVCASSDRPATVWIVPSA